MLLSMFKQLQNYRTPQSQDSKERFSLEDSAKKTELINKSIILSESVMETQCGQGYEFHKNEDCKNWKYQ